jgi:hypothetical protein
LSNANLTKNYLSLLATQSEAVERLVKDEDAFAAFVAVVESDHRFGHTKVSKFSTDHCFTGARACNDTASRMAAVAILLELDEKLGRQIDHLKTLLGLLKTLAHE